MERPHRHRIPTPSSNANTGGEQEAGGAAPFSALGAGEGVPEAKGLVPGARHDRLAVRGHGQVQDPLVSVGPERRTGERTDRPTDGRTNETEKNEFREKSTWVNGWRENGRKLYLVEETGGNLRPSGAGRGADRRNKELERSSRDHRLR